jgi:hypothetical protein
LNDYLRVRPAITCKLEKKFSLMVTDRMEICLPLGAETLPEAGIDKETISRLVAHLFIAALQKAQCK